MIYLWHNANLGMYEMGDEQTYHVEAALYDINLLHEFEADEHRCAEKILKNLRRAAGEKMVMALA